jgi:hypothetical protein
MRTSALLRAQQANATSLPHVAAGGEAAMRSATRWHLRHREQMREAPALAAAVAGSQGTGDFVNLGGRGGAPGFRSETGGIMGGIDHCAADGVLPGIAAGYDRGSLAQSGGTGTTETPSIAVYGRLASSGWDLDATAGYAGDRFHILRPEQTSGATATSGHNGQELSGAVQLHTAVVIDGVTFARVAGLQYVHLLETGSTETGAGSVQRDVARPQFILAAAFHRNDGRGSHHHEPRPAADPGSACVLQPRDRTPGGESG